MQYNGCEEPHALLHNCCIAYAVATHSACLSASLHLFCAIQCAGILRILLLTFIFLKFFRRAAKISSRLFLSSSHQGTHYNDRPPPLYFPPTPLWFPIAPFSLSAYCIHAGGIYSGRKRKEKKAYKTQRVQNKRKKA